MTKPSLAIPPAMNTAPTSTASIPASAIRSSGDRGERDDRRRDQGRHGRVRPQHEDPGRPEDRVDDERHDRRVEAGDRGQPGELRVRHPRGHEHRREHDAGHEVAAEPLAAVRARSSRPGSQVLNRERGGSTAPRLYGPEPLERRGRDVPEGQQSRKRQVGWPRARRPPPLCANYLSRVGVGSSRHPACGTRRRLGRADRIASPAAPDPPAEIAGTIQ